MQLTLGWLESGTRPRLIVNDHMHVHWLNNAAKTYVGTLGVFRLSGRELQVLDKKNRVDFLSLLRSSNRILSTICLAHPPNHHILCTALRLEGENSQYTGLTMCATALPLHFDGEPLRVAFNLTPAEQHIIEKLFCGQTAYEIACELHISLGTVRAHIHHIYDKLDVGSREALFSKLLPYFPNSGFPVSEGLSIDFTPPPLLVDAPESGTFRGLVNGSGL